MAEDMTNKGTKGKTQSEVETDNDDDISDTTKAYTWDESKAILDYIKNTCPCWYDFVKFKFLTGVRTGEAVAFMWCDVEWDKERILIRRSYDRRTKKFYPLKNDRSYKGELVRRFPMPKDGDLWNLLKSIPQGDNNEIVLKSRAKRIIDMSTFGNAWRGRNTASNRSVGIIPALIQQGKISKYLKPYNTRHTFVTHAIFDLGHDEKIVSKWCGHKLETSNKHYQDVAIFAERTNPELPASSTKSSDIEILREQLREQQELINRLMQDRKS
jgi:integrase